MATKKPLLSVTVLNYNYAHYLPICLDSILKQTFQDFELILINDKSTDNSLEVIEPYLRDSRVRLVDHVENKGFMRSLIEGADISQGPYITVISADDWILEPTAFEQQIAVMERDKEVAFTFTDYGCYTSNETCTYLMHPAPESYIKPGLEAFKDIIISRSPLHSGTIIRKTAYTEIGGYDPDTLYAVDTKMWAGLCLVGKVAYINEVLYAYRIHNQNMSRSKEVVRKSITEVLDLIDWSFGLMTKEQRDSLGWLYKKAVRRALASYTILFTFQFNNLKLGWYYFWIAFRMRPAETLLQNTILVLLLRTILGARGYRWFEKMKSLFSSRTRKRLTTEAIHVGTNS
ncbi:glycosyltransferase family 2 protein [Oscillochloris sp. ZM17-4]|uniref:glycosyltransferase family 2 protein n=1 Tax=Oscillochloris sp. ZM17-4 TaxID=2866714 RepID=UPI00210618EA|nr:glycosyltransferase family 2 protein [Oscillochloris sp. ZM17-4]